MHASKIQNQKSLKSLSRLSLITRTIREDVKRPVPQEVVQRFIPKIRWRLTFLIRRYGWKLVAVVVVYYLVRDTTLYIVIPFLVARYMFSR